MFPGDIVDAAAESLGAPFVPTEFADRLVTGGLEVVLYPGLRILSHVGQAQDAGAFNGLDADDPAGVYFNVS